LAKFNVTLGVKSFYEILKDLELDRSFGTSATKNGCGGIKLIDLAHNRGNNAVMNLQVPQNAGNFFASRGMIN
jgi:hypothetical protein